MVILDRLYLGPQIQCRLKQRLLHYFAMASWEWKVI